MIRRWMSWVCQQQMSHLENNLTLYEHDRADELGRSVRLIPPPPDSPLDWVWRLPQQCLVWYYFRRFLEYFPETGLAVN